MSGTHLKDIWSKRNAGLDQITEKLATFLQTWDSDPAAMRQLAAHKYDPSLLPEYDLALLLVEGSLENEISLPFFLYA